MAANDVKKIYQDIINDVCTTVREALQEEGYDDHTLQELRTLWVNRLDISKALEPLPPVDDATQRVYGGKTNSNNSQTYIHNTSMTSIQTLPPSLLNNPGMNFGANQPIVYASNGTPISMQNQRTQPYKQNRTGANNISQIDGTNDEEETITAIKNEIRLSKLNDSTIGTKICKQKRRKFKKQKPIDICFQLDGTVPPASAISDDDEDDEEEATNDVAEEIEDEEDETNEEQNEDANPLCSEDDVSDDEPAEMFEADNVVVCQYDKITRCKNKWRFNLKSGIMNIHGRDYVFNKATGEAEW